MDVVSLKILAGLVNVLDMNNEYESMLRDSSTFDIFVFVLLFRKYAGGTLEHLEKISTCII